MPLPRMTTRRWMIAVAAISMLLAIGTEIVPMYFRSYGYRLRAKSCGANAKLLLGCANAGIEIPGCQPSPPDEPPPTPDRIAEMRRYAAELLREQKRYEYAADHPWLPVPPDPPEPK